MKYLLFTLTLLFSLPAFAAKLAWDANTEPDIAGYKIYYGTISKTYTQTIDVKNVLTYDLKNIALTPKTTYYFALTAYNTAGLESGFSTEVVYTPIAPPANVKILPSSPQASAGTWDTNTVGLKLQGRTMLLTENTK